MFIKTAIAFALALSTLTGALAAPSKQATSTTWDDLCNTACQSNPNVRNNMGDYN
jgi:hypothetical protein